MQSDTCNEISRYEVLEEFKTEKNVDRVRFIKNENGERFALSALYELDKETKKKSGSLIKHKINFDTSENSQNLDENKFGIILHDKIDLSYGVLDYKYITKNTIFGEEIIITANSNCSYTIFKNSPKLEEIQSIAIPSKDHECTCNTLDTYNISFDSTILLAMNDGFHHIYDINTSQSVKSIKSHEYGLWSVFYLDNTTYLTGSEDSLLKLWDSRSGTNKPESTNKHHTASINCIQKDGLITQNDNVIVTGSYDEHFSVIDIRKFDKVVHRQKLDCAIWDMNQQVYKGSKIILMASIYEGFNIFEYSGKEGDYTLNNYLSVKFGDVSPNGVKMHNTIVYGVDSFKDEEDLFISSCSFYDNLVLFWKLK
jgi:diphthine methyl ester acylhydrolase